MSKNATAKEREYMRRVQELGCIVEDCEAEAELHHCFTTMSYGRDHSQVIPLCTYHHRGGVYGASLHSCKKEFERNFGTEQDLLNEVAIKLACKKIRENERNRVIVKLCRKALS